MVVLGRMSMFSHGVLTGQDVVQGRQQSLSLSTFTKQCNFEKQEYSLK